MRILSLPLLWLCCLGVVFGQERVVSSTKNLIRIGRQQYTVDKIKRQNHGQRRQFASRYDTGKKSSRSNMNYHAKDYHNNKKNSYMMISGKIKETPSFKAENEKHDMDVKGIYKNKSKGNSNESDKKTSYRKRESISKSKMDQKKAVSHNNKSKGKGQASSDEYSEDKSTALTTTQHPAGTVDYDESTSTDAITTRPPGTVTDIVSTQIPDTVASSTIVPTNAPTTVVPTVATIVTEQPSATISAAIPSSEEDLNLTPNPTAGAPTTAEPSLFPSQYPSQFPSGFPSITAYPTITGFPTYPSEYYDDDDDDDE